MVVIQTSGRVFLISEDGRFFTVRRLNLQLNKLRLIRSPLFLDRINNKVWFCVCSQLNFFSAPSFYLLYLLHVLEIVGCTTNQRSSRQPVIMKWKAVLDSKLTTIFWLKLIRQILPNYIIWLQYSNCSFKRPRHRHWDTRVVYLCNKACFYHNNSAVIFYIRILEISQAKLDSHSGSWSFSHRTYKVWLTYLPL